ncbi:MAG: DUF2514 family protein [Hydrogenophaga sp.]|uniref:DUF2514 family protein n=1 Tax=Hydrogenophaga sp. TaxID=1904254 RepID=UPI001DCAC1CF|nr:DUF2514 family protein [Hydrogenophaga sp.]MBX3610409.1 DUF2514 family protein [Hydrogenophaga sp.]
MKAALVALLIALGLAGLQSWRLAEEQRDHAETRESYARTLATAVQAERDQQQRRIAALTKEAEDAHVREQTARRDADAARTSGERLRAQLSAVRAAACRGAAASAPGPAADATERMLADVQRRLDEAADGIARFADLAHSAGIACQRSYDALSP